MKVIGTLIFLVICVVASTNALWWRCATSAMSEDKADLERTENICNAISQVLHKPVFKTYCDVSSLHEVQVDFYNRCVEKDDYKVYDNGLVDRRVTLNDAGKFECEPRVPLGSTDC